MEQTHAAPTYGSYWIAWIILLAVTVLMVFVGSPAILLAGIAFKACVILVWFMHLRWERKDLLFMIFVGIFVTAAIMFGLLIPDGKAM